MPLNAAGDIVYLPLTQERLLFQADPPVCTLCTQAITRANVGWMYRQASPSGQVECIWCRACTGVRAHGPLLRGFVQQHSL